ncbi:MAG: phosphatidate cytidylyltransferase [Methylovirgula sp.]
MILAAVSQLGDLFESWMKRCFGAKDSGHLISGSRRSHGSRRWFHRHSSLRGHSWRVAGVSVASRRACFIGCKE